MRGKSPSALAQVARGRLKRGYNGSTPLGGKDGRLSSGQHSVTIDMIDTSDLYTQAKVAIVFKGADEATHIQNMYVLDKDKEDYSVPFKHFINALFADPEAWDILDDIVADDSLAGKLFSMLTGLNVSIVLGSQGGYSVERMDDGYYIVDVTSRALLSDECFANKFQANKAASLIAGKSQSVRRVLRYESSSEQAVINNREVFDATVTNLKQASDTTHSITRLFDPLTNRANEAPPS